MFPSHLPTDYARIKLVRSFEELISTRFANGVNALCWPRTLRGDFDEVVAKLAVGRGITTIDDEQLKSLELSAAGEAARETLLADQELLRAHDLAPVLDCINGYVNEEEPGPMRTDVCSFHADSATVEADTWLCSYNVTATEGLRNEEARRKIDVPEIRAELRRHFGGEEGAEFEEYLAEQCHDLHYVPLPGAKPFSFGFGNLWRIALEYPGSPVPPCIHRAPTPAPGQKPRLLLLS